MHSIIAACLCLVVSVPILEAQECRPVYQGTLSVADGGAAPVFGSDVVLTDDEAFVGAQEAVIDGVQSGAVYTYALVGGAWERVGRLVPPDARDGQLFGTWISVDGDTMMIGAPHDDELGEDNGAVYVFERVDGDWCFVQKLLPSIGEELGAFGYVFHRGGMAVIGAAARTYGDIEGAAYVFEYDGNEWIETQRLTANDGGPGEVFGLTPVFDDDWLAIGAPFARNELNVPNGACYVYRREEGAWVETQVLEPDVFDFGHTFGFDLALEDGRLLIGDPDADQRRGEVVAYELDAGVWKQTQVIGPEIGGLMGFGNQLAMDGSTLLIGAPDTQMYAGAASVYSFEDDAWVYVESIGYAPSPDLSLFGARLDINAQTMMIAAPLDDANAGAVYVYGLVCDGCYADLNGDGAMSADDVGVFLAAFDAGSLLADFTLDGELDFFDVSAFLEAYSAGCQ